MEGLLVEGGWAALELELPRVLGSAEGAALPPMVSPPGPAPPFCPPPPDSTPPTSFLSTSLVSPSSQAFFCF